MMTSAAAAKAAKAAGLTALTPKRIRRTRVNEFIQPQSWDKRIAWPQRNPYFTQRYWISVCVA